MPHASSPPLQHRLQSTCITKMYTFPCFIQSRPLSFPTIRVLLWNTGTHCPVGGQDILLKVYRVFFVNESEKFRGETNPLIRGGYIFTNVPPLFSPSSVLLLVIPSGTFPNPLPLSVSAAANSGFHSFFFFLFVSFCRHRLSVTHCPRYCDNVLRVTKLYSLRRKEKLGPYKHRNTLVDVLKRVFPRFRSPSPSILYSGRALLFPA